MMVKWQYSTGTFREWSPRQTPTNKLDQLKFSLSF